MNWASQRCSRRCRSSTANRQAQRRSLRFESLESRRMLDASQFVISEVLINPHGVDGGQEYIEIRATSGLATTLPAGTYLLGIEGDTFAANPGDLQNIFDLSGLTTGANGVLVLTQKGNSYSVAPAAATLTNTGSGIGWGNGATSSLGHTADGIMTDIENGSMTLMLVFAPVAPTLATDIDSNNDGVPDGAEFASWTVLDSVGLLDGVNDDFGYGAINFRFGPHGSSQGTLVEIDFNPGYIARKGNATGATADHWIAGYVSGSANNWALSTTQVSDPSYAGQPLNHLGSANPNSSPILIHSAGTFDEGSSRALTSADLQATDLEQSAAALQFSLSSLPVYGLIQKDGSPLAVGDQFTQADVDAGRIAYTHDGSETTNDSFSYSVDDSAGGSASGTFDITINPVNDAPVLALNAGLTIDEDATAALDASLLQTVDVDNTAEQLTYTLVNTPAHGTLAKGGVALTPNDTFTQHDVDQGLVTYQHNGDLASVDAFSFTLSDGSGGAIGETTFTIAITQFNLPPTIAANEPAVSVVEGTLATMSGTYADADGELVILTASIGAVVDNGDGTWTWSYTPAQGPEDSQLVNVTVDDGLATAQATFSLEVANAAPLITVQNVEVTVDEGETATNGGTFADVPADNITLTASIGAVVDNADGTWTWTWTTTNGPEDSQLVTITADDGLATSTVTFQLQVANVAPGLTVAESEVSALEGSLATNSGTISDVAADTVTLTASIGTVINHGDGTWAWTCETSEVLDDSQVVTITADDGLAQTQVTFLFHVIDLDPKIEADLAAVSVDEGQTAENTGTFKNFASETLVVSASIGAVVDNGDGTWSWSYTTTNGPAESQTVTVTADDGTARSQASFFLTVNNVAPIVAADLNKVVVIEGEIAVNTGTFADVAADAVTLSASFGAVIDNGNGTWSWSFATASAALDTGPVTITAKDNDNLLSIVVFQLVVNSPMGEGSNSLSSGEPASDANDPFTGALDDAFALLGAESP